MKDWIRNLLALQACDTRTKRMKAQLAEIPKRRQNVKQDMDRRSGAVKQAETAILETRKKITQVESEIEAFNAKIRKCQEQSAMVKKNDEYRAMLHEIDGHKRKIGEQESKIITLMEEMDARKKDLEKAQKEFGDLEKNAKDNLEELSELEAGLKAEIKKETAARPALVAVVDQAPLRIYERLAKSRGEAFTQIQNESCGNCYMKLTPQTLNDAKKGQVVLCDSCARLVYYPDAE